jgi:hypothetical protein
MVTLALLSNPSTNDIRRIDRLISGVPSLMRYANKRGTQDCSDSIAHVAHSKRWRRRAVMPACAP